MITTHMHDLHLLQLALGLAAVGVIAYCGWRRHKKVQALRWAARNLNQHRPRLQDQHKTFLQQEHRAPQDPKLLFLREHYNRQARRFNAIVDRHNTEARKL